MRISQTNAIAEAQTYPNCVGCHLISEAEWLTIAQNVLSVASNWSTGTVGGGYIYSGHNDNVSTNVLEASSSDSDGYYNTGNTTDSNQKRTLTLSNNEVIWYMAGNVYDWTSGISIAGQPGNSGIGWRQWNAILNKGNISPDPSPSNTGIYNANSWSSANGIGQIYSNSDDLGTNSILRGNYWYGSSYAGLMTMNMAYYNYSTRTAGGYNFGFRASR